MLFILLREREGWGWVGRRRGRELGERNQREERKETLTCAIEGTREMKKRWRASMDPGGMGGNEKERKDSSVFSWPFIYA